MKNLQILVSKQGITSKLKSRKFGKKKIFGRRHTPLGRFHRDTRDKGEFSELLLPKTEPSVNHTGSMLSNAQTASDRESLNSTNSLPIFTQSGTNSDGIFVHSGVDSNNTTGAETEDSKWPNISAAGKY